MKRLLKSCSALVAVGALLPLTVMRPALAQIVTPQPNLNSTVSAYAISPSTDPMLSTAMMTALVRNKIKYVFVIFHENNSFDHEYGTFPGVNGLYYDGYGNARSTADTPGFTQTYKDINGATHTVKAFRLGPGHNSTFADSTDHSHSGNGALNGQTCTAASATYGGLAYKLDVVNGVPQMDKFAQDEYCRQIASSSSAAGQAKGAEYANLVMSYVDCNTIPFFWQYANRFTIFDNIFATEDTPSSPNAIAMIAGQSGETQWVEHPSEAISLKTADTQSATLAYVGTINGKTYNGSGASPLEGVPVINDPQPWYGSPFDATTNNRQPVSTNESWSPTNISVNLTFANVLLTLGGKNIATLMAGDRNAAFDQADIQTDIPYIQGHSQGSFAWRWYQNGYDAEPGETGSAITGHANYVSHHNGAQYFGYISNNTSELINMKGENDFFVDLSNNNLPSGGGVFYIRGGYNNLVGQTPPIQNPKYPNAAGDTAADIAAINTDKAGDDDHPSYSDKQLSEAMTARAINAIANSPYWSQSAIIITYDESDGLYDHVAPRILSYGPDGLPQARGVRIPLLLISPYARAGAVSHAEGDHNAIIETISAIFGAPPLSSLPAEAAALAAGNSSTFNDFGPAGFQQKYLGPRDTNSPITDSLLSGFSPMRLRGLTAPLPASYAIIPGEAANGSFALPHYSGNGCSAIGVTPTDQNLTTGPGSIPVGFNTLPSTLPQYNVILP